MSNTENTAVAADAACPYCGRVHPVVDGVRVFGCARDAFAPAVPTSDAKMKRDAVRRTRRYGHEY